jgi:hypothetical protein
MDTKVIWKEFDEGFILSTGSIKRKYWINYKRAKSIYDLSYVVLKVGSASNSIGNYGCWILSKTILYGK